jgi:hypothetical protein
LRATPRLPLGCLGFAGANLAEMARIGLPVPSGFTVRAEGCALNGKLPKDMIEEVRMRLLGCSSMRVIPFRCSCSGLRAREPMKKQQNNNNNNHSIK